MKNTQNFKNIEKIILLKDNKFKFKMARDTMTKKSILEILSKSRNRNVRMFVAANPSINQKTKETLVKDEDGFVLLHLSKNPKLEEKYLDILARNGINQIRASVAMHKNTSKKTRDILLNEEEIVEFLTFNSKTSFELIEYIENNFTISENSKRNLIDRGYLSSHYLVD